MTGIIATHICTDISHTQQLNEQVAEIYTDYDTILHKVQDAQSKYTVYKYTRMYRNPCKGVTHSHFRMMVLLQKEEGGGSIWQGYRGGVNYLQDILYHFNVKRR